MSEFRFLCPRCGQAFREGLTVTECPRCHVPLLTASAGMPADAENLPPRLDIDALMKRILADQQPGEDIDSALDRVIRREYPSAHDSLSKVIHNAMDLEQKVWGGTRQEAGQRLAQDRSQLEMQPDGKPMVKTLHQEINVRGVALSPEQQEQVKQELEEAVRTGKPIERLQINLTAGKRSVGCATRMFVAICLTVVAWAKFRP